MHPGYRKTAPAASRDGSMKSIQPEAGINLLRKKNYTTILRCRTSEFAKGGIFYAKKKEIPQIAEWLW